MGVAEDVAKVVEPTLAQAGVELVDVEYQREPGGWILRCYLDKPGGFSLADCGEWNDRLGALLDEAGLIQHSYSLEISSPGLNRPLKKPADFERFLGIEAVIRLYAPQNGQKNFHGKMVRVENGELHLDDRTAGPVKIPLAAIASAKLDPPIDMNRPLSGA
jgi:ribosome maturation factor RimP